MKLTRISSSFLLAFLSVGVLIAGRKGTLNLPFKRTLSFTSESWRVEEGVVAPGWGIARLSSDLIIVLFRSIASEILAKAHNMLSDFLDYEFLGLVEAAMAAYLLLTLV